MSFASLILKELSSLAVVAVDGTGRVMAANAATSTPKKKSGAGCSPCAALAAQQKAREQVVAFKKRNGFGE